MSDKNSAETNNSVWPIATRLAGVSTAIATIWTSGAMALGGLSEPADVEINRVPNSQTERRITDLRVGVAVNVLSELPLIGNNQNFIISSDRRWSDEDQRWYGVLRLGSIADLGKQLVTEKSVSNPVIKNGNLFFLTLEDNSINLNYYLNTGEENTQGFSQKLPISFYEEAEFTIEASENGRQIMIRGISSNSPINIYGVFSELGQFQWIDLSSLNPKNSIFFNNTLVVTGQLGQGEVLYQITPEGLSSVLAQVEFGIIDLGLNSFRITNFKEPNVINQRRFYELATSVNGALEVVEIYVEEG